MVAVALYGPHGLLDRRPANDRVDAKWVAIEMLRERGGLDVGQRLEIEPFRTTVPV